MQVRKGWGIFICPIKKGCPSIHFGFGTASLAFSLNFIQHVVEQQHGQNPGYQQYQGYRYSQFVIDQKCFDLAQNIFTCL